MSIKSGTIMSGRWCVGEKLGEGACAIVFEANESNRKDKNFNRYVIKCIPLPTGKGKSAASQAKIVNTLYYEHVLYRGVLLDFKYAPKLPPNAYGEDMGYRYLVMQRLDSDLKTFAQTRLPSTQSIGLIGLNIIDGLRILHSKGHVFVDIKPDNFMILKASDHAHEFTSDDKLFFVDFGLVEKYTQYAGGGSHRPVANRNGVAGTPAFVSLSVHEGSLPCRKDDIEAMGYMLLSLRMGAVLPWSTATSEASCRASKRSCDISKLAQEAGCPEVGEIILYARSLAFDAQPDYDRCVQLLSAMQSRPESRQKTTGKRGAVSQQREEERHVLVDLTMDANTLQIPQEQKTVTSAKPKKQKSTTSSAASVALASPQRDTASRKLAAASAVATTPQHSVEPVSGTKTNKKLGSGTRAEVESTGPFGGDVQLSPRRSPRLSSGGTAQGLPVQVVLEAIAGPHTGQMFSVGAVASEALRLGRCPTCAIVLDGDEYLSENHMSVRVELSSSGVLGLQVRDSGSRNGTLVGGSLLAKKRWEHVGIGEVIEAGRSMLKVTVIAI